MTLYHHTGKKYVSVKPNKHGRLAIPELDIEVALEGGWVRIWYKGKLLPLPAEMQRELQEATRRNEDLERQLAEAQRELSELRRQSQTPSSRNDGKKRSE